jgi:hypothetical protein
MYGGERGILGPTNNDLTVKYLSSKSGFPPFETVGNFVGTLLGIPRKPGVFDITLNQAKA